MARLHGLAGRLECPDGARPLIHTNQIIAQLEAERVPWVQASEMTAAKASLAMPRNAATGRPYSGINVLLPWGRSSSTASPCQSWLTFRQALSLGGDVRDGERGTTVVYADRFVPGGTRKRTPETGDDPLRDGFNTSILDQAPMSFMKAIVPPRRRGDLLDADTTPTAVLFHAKAHETGRQPSTRTGGCR